MIFNPDSEFVKIADRSTKNWQRMRSHARVGSNLGLNIKKPGTENGKVIIFNGIDGVRKMARAMLTSDAKHIHSSGLEMSPAQSPFFSLPEYGETDWRKQSLHHYLRFTTVLHSLFIFLKWEFEDG